MSTIKVTNIEHGSTTDGGIQLDSSGHVTVDGQQMPTAGALSNRNLIINGAMQVAQRGTSETGVTGDGYHTVDRARIDLSSLGTYTVTQSTDAPEGFSNSFKLECTTAQSSPAAGAYFVYQQRIEGQNLQMIKKGTSNAQQLTVSFWVKSDKTGTYILGLNDRDNDRVNSKSYTISSADTWEYKTLTYEADTTGTFNNDNAESLRLDFWLASGSNFNSGTLSTGWETFTNANRAVGNVNLSDTVGNDWSITGLQLEVGEKATPFEHRSYGDELARCQRYFQRISGDNDAYTYPSKGQGSGSVDATIPLCVPLRASPTMNAIDSRTFTDSSSFAASSSTAPTASHFNANNPHLAVNCGGFSGLTNNEVSVWGPRSNALEISAEL